jgi:hypothetical protein
MLDLELEPETTPIEIPVTVELEPAVEAQAVIVEKAELDTDPLPIGPEDLPSTAKVDEPAKEENDV